VSICTNEAGYLTDTGVLEIELLWKDWYATDVRVTAATKTTFDF